MSNEIFKWQPQMLDTDEKVNYNVISSGFENGMTQRGLLSDRETTSFTFVYKHKLLEPGAVLTLKNEIKDFFNDRHGSYDNFFLPSWKLDGVISDAITTADNTFKLGKDPSYLGFSKTLCEAGNYIYICKRFAKGFEVPTTVHEIRRITDWSGSGDDWTVTVDSTFDNDYDASTSVQKAYKVFFKHPELPSSFAIPYVVEFSLEFVEDLASLYQSDFGV